MPFSTLKKLFSRADSTLPWRITTSRFHNQPAHEFARHYGVSPVPGTDIRLRATRWDNRYHISVIYQEKVEGFTQYSRRTSHAEKATLKLDGNFSEAEMVKIMAGFETAGRESKITPDEADPPTPMDGSTHIVKLLKNPKILASIRPRLYAASRLKHMRHKKPGNKPS